MKNIFLFCFTILSFYVNAQSFLGWDRKQKITINSSLVDGTSPLVDFPVLITLSHLNTEVIDRGVNSALNGGGDIRFSSDPEGNVPLAIEVVEFITNSIPTNRKCQIWVKIPSLSPTSDTEIYLWYNKSGEIQPASTSPYGSQSVWSNNYVSVWHMEEDPSGTAPQVLDSGLGSNNGTAGGNMLTSDLVPSKIGNGLTLNGIDQFVNVGNDASLNLTSNLTISGWFNPTKYDDMYLFAKRNETVAQGYNILLYYPDGEAGIYDTTAYWHSNSTGYSLNQWNYISLKINASGTGYACDYNGTSGSEEAIPAFPDGSNQNLYLGARSNGSGLPFSGSIDEFRVSSIARSKEWAKTEYNNQLDPSLFASAGTSVEAVSPSAPTLSNSTKTEATVNLNWTVATDNVAVTGYNIYKNSVLESTLGNVLDYHVTGLTPSTSYSFAVTALDAAGNESADSNILAITTDASSGGGSGIWTLNNQDVYYDTGNVGIGITTPDEKLSVNGNIHAKEVRVDLNDWPDYVFTKNYDLPKLKQVENYIKTNGHLLNIPSAQEVEENGIQLGEMNIKLLEKIEELVLYILQQEKRLENLEKNK